MSRRGLEILTHIFHAGIGIRCVGTDAETPVARHVEVVTILIDGRCLVERAAQLDIPPDFRQTVGGCQRVRRAKAVPQAARRTVDVGTVRR